MLRRDFRSGARNGGPRARSRRLGGRRGESRQRALEADWRAGMGARGLEMRRGAKLASRWFLSSLDGKYRERGCFSSSGQARDTGRRALVRYRTAKRWRPRGYPFTRYSYRGSPDPEERHPPRSGGPICGGRVRRWMRAITLDPQTARSNRPAERNKGVGYSRDSTQAAKSRLSPWTSGGGRGADIRDGEGVEVGA